jgi:hypothetical protein
MATRLAAAYYSGKQCEGEKMTENGRLRLPELILLLIVLAVAGGARAWYLSACAEDGNVPGPLEVQGQPPSPHYDAKTRLRGREHPTQLDALVENLTEYRWFGSLAPLAQSEERTAHVAPGYPWLVAVTAHWFDDADTTDRAVRWGQCLLGALTAGFYFLFARRAFGNLLVAAIAGFLCALQPFWIINTAEVNDGVAATFLMSAVLALGTRGSQDAGPFISLLFGLALAGLCMVRAALLPFACVAVLWYILRCRKLPRGWLAALLAFLGFANGLAPWTVRNFKIFAEPVPIADSGPWHLWIGNNPAATGGPLDEGTVERTLGAKRLQELGGEEACCS